MQPVREDEARARQSVPERHGAVVLDRLVRPPVLELDAGVLSERHEVGQEEPVGRLDLVLGVRGSGGAGSADGVPGKRERRRLASIPVVATAAPLLRARPLGLGRLAVVEEESRVPFERREHGVVGEREGGAHEAPAEIAAALDLRRVEQHEVLPRRRRPLVRVGRMEVADPRRRVDIRLRPYLPADLRHRRVRDDLDERALEEGHREVRRGSTVLASKRRGPGMLGRGTAGFRGCTVSRSEEERDGGIDGRGRPPIPRDADPGGSERLLLAARNREAERADGPRPSERSDGRGADAEARGPQPW